MGGDYGRGFWSVALFRRCAGLVVGLALSSVATAQLPEDPKARLSAWSFVPKHITNAADTYAGNLAECQTTPPNGSSSVCVLTEHAQPENYYPAPTRHWCITGQVYHDTGTTYRCAVPPTDCALPPGTTGYFDDTSSTLCYQGCRWTRSQGGSLGVCLGPNGDDCNYATKYESFDEYCESPGGQPSRPFDEYTDEDGCYYDTNGQKFCSIPPDSPCPNYVVVDGKKYCRGAQPDDGEPDPLPDHDSDGDGIPDRHDEHPDDPDADGDGTPDGEQDGDGNGIPDGDPGGIADDGEGDGNEPGEGHHDGGTCEPDERAEPECSENMDPIQCALAIELFHVRCDARMDHQDFVGDEEYLEGPSITSSEDGDGDGQPDNAIPTASLDASTVVSGLSEDTISFGNLACPADKTFSMPGAFGGSFTLSWEPICDWAAMVRPIVIALGYLMSALIILRKFSGGSE